MDSRPQVGCLAISARTGLGIDELCEEIAARARAMLGDGSSALVIRERHRDAIGAARDFIAAALAPGKPLGTRRRGDKIGGPLA